MVTCQLPLGMALEKWRGREGRESGMFGRMVEWAVKSVGEGRARRMFRIYEYVAWFEGAFNPIFRLINLDSSFVQP